MKEEIKELIDKVLLHQELSVELPKIPIGQIIAYVTETIGVQYESETNGYQCDFWIDWADESRDIKFTLCGDLWHNETHRFEIGI